MAGAHVEFTGDASGAAAAAAAAQAAIDAVHGKTVNVTINVRKTGSGDLDAATGAMDRAARAGERAAASARAHERASARAASSARDHASASDRAGASMGRLGDNSDRAGRQLEGTGRSADRYRSSVGGVGRDSDRASSSTRKLGDSVEKISQSLGDIGDNAARAGKSLNSLNKIGGAVGTAGAIIGPASSALTMYGTAALYATAGSGILTAAVGALGVAGVGALGGVGVAAGVAGGAMAKFAVDAHQDSARFGNTLQQMGKQSHLASQAISEPLTEAIVGLGRQMVGADNVMKPAGAGIVNSLRDGFSNVAGVVNRSSDSIVSAASVAARGLDTLTADAAPGVEAFLSTMPSLAAGAVSGMSQVTSEFGRSAGAIEGAAPAFNRAMGAAGGFGAEMVRIGAGAAIPFSENMTSMLGSATNMASQLGPAIKPSMQAFTDVATAGMGGIGSLTPEISSFAKTVSDSAPGLRSLVQSAGQIGLSFGESTVGGIADSAPDWQETAKNSQGRTSARRMHTRAASSILANVADAVDGMLSGEGLFGNAAAAKALENNRSTGATPGLFSKGGAVDMLTGGGVSAYAGAVANRGGAKATPESDAAMSAASRAAGPRGPMRTPGPMEAVMGAASGPLPGNVAGGPPLKAPALSAGGGIAAPSTASAFSGLFTGATQTAQQGAAAIPAAMQSAMTQSRTAIGAANLGGAMRAPMAAMQGAVAGANIGGAVGGQINQATRVTQNSVGAAGAAGAKVGGAIGGGVAKGTSSSMTVTDEVIINRVQKVKETAMRAMNARSPSRDFEKIGRYIPQGFDLGVANGFGASRAGDSMAAEISARSNAAMSASSGRFAQQAAQVDADRTMMQSLKIGVGGGRGLAERAPLTPSDDDRARQISPRDRANVAAQWGGPHQNTRDDKGNWAPKSFAEGQYFGALHRLDQQMMGKGADKQAFFGEAPGTVGTRQVFDRKTYGWEAKPGVQMKDGDAFSPDMVQSALSPDQRGAMETLQNRLDQGVNRNYGMFAERTMQNLERGRVGAFAVTDAMKKKDAQDKQQQERFGTTKPVDKPVDITPGGAPVGGSGAGGQSYLGRDRINMVRQAANLGGEVAAGYGQGLAAGQNSAVSPMGRLAAAQRKRYTDDWGISSPSRVAAGMSGDVVAGFGGGLSANTAVATGAVGSLVGAMQEVGNDRSLMVGYTWGENITNGVASVLKKADYVSAGLPNLESKAAMVSLASTGLLKAGSGASIVKTVGNTPSVVTLGNTAPSRKQSFTIRHQIDMGGQMHEIATEVFLDNLGRVEDAVSVAAR